MFSIYHIVWLLGILLPAFPPEARGDTGDRTVRILAVGDVNLGRRVGQVLLSGDTLYPFLAVADTFKAYDVVFANLESQLSDQDGETVHPGSNLVFTGPPSGGHALARGGVTVVSTANNHALDYGVEAAAETMVHLRDAGVLFAGTAPRPDSLYEPILFVRNGIRFALFAVTGIMNRPGSEWQKHVAAADTGLLFPSVRKHRATADVVLLSFHGGAEYSDEPAPATQQFARATLDAGVDLFLGHHPHVPHRVEQRGNKYIVYSLGNFVFQQPSRWWTQYSFAFTGTFVKRDSTTMLSSVSCLPVRCGYQPAFLSPGPEYDRVLQRVQVHPSRLAGEVSLW